MAHLRPNRIRVWIFVTGLLGVCTAAKPVGAQVYDVPPSSQNERFFKDIYVSKHPSLTFNGFSCAPQCAYGLGVAEVLELLKNSATSGRPTSYARHIVSLALETIGTWPEDRQEVIQNSRRLQARGILALLLLVAEAQEEAIGGLQSLNDAPLLGEALESFFEALRTPSAFQIRRSFSDDAVKWVAPLTNLARSFDLLLAIENAYAYYPRERFSTVLPSLLTCSEKADVLSFLTYESDALDDLGNLPVFLGIKRDEIQSGNWSMKVHVAVGYAALTQQLPVADACQVLPTAPFDHWLERAIRSAGAPTNQNRSKHWNYQTDSGRRLFAEGPYYFHLALSDIVPFWHSLRISGLLNFHPDFELSDPFHSTWFTEPLDWLADTVAPGGEILPLDDGNRIYMSSADLLRWSGDYGSAGLGRKYAWISNQRPADDDPDPDFLGLLLAIPAIEDAEGAEPHAMLGEIPSLESARTDEQVVVLRRPARKQDGLSAVHYLALNGEYGDAIIRGEGHEQPDQMQLVYYIDDVSVLVDSGYDDAAGIENSTWNHYYDHNVLTIHSGNELAEGGLSPPVPDIYAFRIVSNHAEADDLGLHNSGKIDVLKGEIQLSAGDATGQKATYYRRILFIGDDEAPYVIDLNRGVVGDGPLSFRMSYHLGGEYLREANAGYQWRAIGLRGSVVETRVIPFRIDGTMSVEVRSDAIMEQFRTEATIDRLDLISNGPAESFTTVAFMFPGVTGVVMPQVEKLSPASKWADSVSVWSVRHESGDVDIFFAALGSSGTSETMVLVDNVPVVLTLAMGAEFGFIRLAADTSPGSWTAVPGFSYQLSAHGSPVGIRENHVTPEGPLIISPNPAHSLAQIGFSADRPGRVLLAIYDVQGREVVSVLDQEVRMGRHGITWNSESLANGVYFLRKTTASGSQSLPFVVRH